MAIPSRPAGKLGKLQAKVPPKALNFTKYVTTAILPALPLKVAWERKVNQWSMFLNDQLGDCVEASIGHTIMTMTSMAGIQATPSDAEIEQAYSDIAGYIPGIPSTDNGTYVIDALNFWKLNGIAGHKILGWAKIKIDPALLELRHAIALFGAVLVGINFPQSAMDQFNAGQSWHTDLNSPILGGHCISISEYDPVQLVCETWGALQPMSLGFLPFYADEAYAVITQDWIESNKRSPSGYNISVLENDLRVF